MALNQWVVTRVSMGDNEYVGSVLDGGMRWDTFGHTGNSNIIRWNLLPNGWTNSKTSNQLAAMQAALAETEALYESVADIDLVTVPNAGDADILVQWARSAMINGAGGVSGFPSEAFATRPFGAVTTAEFGRVNTFVGVDGSSGPRAAPINTFRSDGSITMAGQGLINHEIGHALGLKHPHDSGGSGGNAAVLDNINNDRDLGDHGLNHQLNTIMSYNVEPTAGGANIGLGAYDIAALQQIYGARLGARGGNDTYRLVDPTPRDGNSVVDGANWGGAIWDTGGTDVIVYTGNANAVIDLRPATLDDDPETSGGGRSYTWTQTATGGFLYGRGGTIAADIKNVLTDVNGETGVIIENASGGNGKDTLIGNRAGNVLKGNNSVDTIFGHAGADILDGGAGADLMYGGADDDTFYVNHSGDQVNEVYLDPTMAFELDYGGNDLVISTVSFKLPEAVERLTLTGTAPRGEGNHEANIITGNARVNTLVGGAGDDTLIGGGGKDAMYGGSDDDTYVDVEAGERVEELFNEGTDTVSTKFKTFQIPVNVENLMITGLTSTKTIATGNELNNVITAQAAAFASTFTLSGGDGLDTIYGSTTVTDRRLAPGDTLDGGAANDHLYGLGNNDILRGGAGIDWLDGGIHDDTLTGGSDRDLFIFGTDCGQDVVTDFDLAQELLDLSGVAGLTSREQLTINGSVITFGTNTITLTGIDASKLTDANFKFALGVGQTFDGTMAWGGTIVGTAGADTLSYATANAAIYIDLMREGGYAESGSPAQSAHMTSIEHVTGATDQFNYLHGNAADNILIGGNTFDWLTGRGGSNTIDGRGGIDLADYYETDQPVTIDLMSGRAMHATGVDTLIGVEQFRGTNQTDIFIGDDNDNYYNAMNGNDTISGNGGNDYLLAFDGINIIDGGAGDDTIFGGADNDVLTGGFDADTFMFRDADNGHDRVTDFNFAQGDRINFAEHNTVNGYANVIVGANSAGDAIVSFGTSAIVLEGIEPLAVKDDWFVW